MKTILAYFFQKKNPSEMNFSPGDSGFPALEKGVKKKNVLVQN